MSATAEDTGLAASPGLPAAPTGDPSWVLVERGFTLAREHEIESLFAVANGYVGTRGSLAEGSSLSAPATFVAGVFDRPANSGAIPELVIAPDWMRLIIAVEGEPLRLESGDALEHRRMLDLRQGILWRVWRHRDAAGRVTRIDALRLASLADRHLLVQSVVITPENYSAPLFLETRIERPAHQGRDPDSPRAELEPIARPARPGGNGEFDPRVVALRLRAAGTGTTVVFACASELRAEGMQPLAPDVDADRERIVERWEVGTEFGRSHRLDRLVSIYTTRDVDAPARAARAHLDDRLGEGIERQVAAHVRAWETRWSDADMAIEGDADAQRALRFSIYHLIATANPEDERVSVGARALTGEAYKGHVFWDTEIYMLPFYVFTHPPTARALLLYRYHTLDGARKKARAFGCRGAFYAWESADTGEETTPPLVVGPDGFIVELLTGEQEIHISAGVAYGVWQYWRATGDDAFLRDAGAEILIETARFWASRGRFEDDGRFHIRHVIGPDEYHEDVDDNVFTNLMARWNLERAVETVARLREHWPERYRELSDRIRLADDEPGRWRRIAAAMFIAQDPETGIFEQFQGYFDLEEVDLGQYEPRSTPMDVILGAERTRRTQIIKQADVVMALFLLWDRFPREVIESNFRYYEPRCGHGSSLSPSIHALVAARLGDTDLAYRYFRQAAEIDLSNTMGNAAGGVHAAALGGLWQSVVFGFAGMRLLDDGLAFDPRPPEGWRPLRFPLRWRGRRIEVAVELDSLAIRLERGRPMTVVLGGGPTATLRPGEPLRARRAGPETAWRPEP